MLRPFVCFCASLKLFTKDAHRTSECAEVLQLPKRIFVCEFLPGSFQLGVSSSCIKNVDCLTNGKRPKFFIDHGWPSLHCMSEQCSCPVGNCANVSFSNAILPMSTHSTEGVGLFVICALFCEFFGCKNAIVSMNVLDSHSTCH